MTGRGRSSIRPIPSWTDLFAAGEGWIIASGSKQGVMAVTFPFSTLAAAEWVMQAEYQVLPRSSPPHIRRELDGFLGVYFSGRAPEGRVSLDLDALTPFTQKVLNATVQIPWGSVCSYGNLADRVNCPSGARAVGQALGRNPVPILVPCHRVVSSDGGPGGFGGGLCWKRRLLELERQNLDSLDFAA